MAVARAPGMEPSTELQFTMDLEVHSDVTAAETPAFDVQEVATTRQQLMDLLKLGRREKQVEALLKLAKSQSFPTHQTHLLDCLARCISVRKTCPVTVRRSQGSRTSGECLRSLKHAFLLMDSSLSHPGSASIILDPFFKDQFALHDPTPRYQAMYALLPEEYIGRPSNLSDIVSIIGHEMQLSCNAKGTALPPWRATKSLLTKWFPAHYDDTTYTFGAPSRPSEADQPRPVSAPPRAAQVIRGFNAPPAAVTGPAPVVQQKRARSMELPPSPLRKLKGHAAVPAANPDMWQIRTVRLGQKREARSAVQEAVTAV